MHLIYKKCDWLESFINIWHSSQDHLKTGDCRNKREDGRCPLKMGASRSKRESWNICASTRDMKSILNSLFFSSNELIKFPNIYFLAALDAFSASSTISAYNFNLSLVWSYKYLSMQLIKESQVSCDVYNVLLAHLSRYCLIIGSSSY